MNNVRLGLCDKRLPGRRLVVGRVVRHEAHVRRVVDQSASVVLVLAQRIVSDRCCCAAVACAFV